MSSIARAAGLGNAGLIHHFPTKAALYRAILESIGADLDARDAAGLADAATPLDRLRGLVDALTALGQEHPTALMIITQELLDRSGRIGSAAALPLAGVVRDTVTVIEDGQAEGSVRDGNPVALTAALHGALLMGFLGQAIYIRTAERDSLDAAWRQDVAAAAIAGVVSAKDHSATPMER